MKSFHEWASVLKENEAVSKNMSYEEFEKILRSMMVVQSGLEDAIRDWKNDKETARKAGGVVTVPMHELTEWQSRVGSLAEQLEIIKDDISAGPTSAWNY